MKPNKHEAVASARAAWYQSYRLARIVIKMGPNDVDMLVRCLRGLDWRAYAVLAFHRNRVFGDPYHFPAHERLRQYKLADEIVEEIRREEQAK